jgi:hypothetical protein
MLGGINPTFSYGFAFITNLFTDFSAQAQFQFPVGAYGGGLGGRLNTTTGSHYAVWIYPENSVGGSNVLKLLRFDSYSSYVVLQAANLAAVGTNFHTLTLQFSGSQINAYFDTNKLLSVTDANYASGSISLEFWTDATGYQMAVDNVAVQAPTATATINGAQTYQLIEGFGVNANHRSWTNNELQPVLDALIDQAGMTLFRVIYDNADWETNNENIGPTLTNWTYFSTAYSTPEFQALWGIMAYLNQKGITNGLMPNFQGFGPSWMGGLTLKSGNENAWAEMIASALVYARYTNHLQFTLVGPNNEPDSPSGGGIGTTAAQYVLTLDDLSQQLNANGMGDVQFVGPDLANTSTAWLSAMMNDTTVMSKLAHFGLHGYEGMTVGSPGVYAFLQGSAYPDITFWMTEFNVWCQVCQTGGQGTNNWDYFLGTADYLLANLANGASGGVVWEGYDSIYRNNNNDGLRWSFWGLFAVNDTNAVPKTYTARKNFYTLSQITAFVRPGARRIDVSGSVLPLTLLAFYNTNNAQLTLTGDNTNSSAWNLSGTLTSLPAIPNLNLYYTSSTTNLCNGGSVVVTNGTFSVVVPADCVFTLTFTIDPPVITTQPTNLLVLPATNVAFGVSATSTVPLGYQWQFNGTNILNATNALYAIPSVGTNNAGNYSVVVTNAAGAVTSSNAALTVVLSPGNQTNYASSTAIFTAAAFSPELLNYQWQKNGTNLVNGGNLSGATNSTLTIAGVSDADAANYSAVVSDATGSVTTSNATLTVKDMLFIDSQPQSQTVSAGATVTFNVTVYGAPPFVFQWYFNGTPLGPPATGTNLSSCILTNVGTNQAGNYSVEVVNGYGGLTSSNAALTVVALPAITTQPVSRTNNAATTATFSVVASSLSPLSYQWQKNNTNLVNAGRISGATNSTLTIASVSDSDAASYSVTVTNLAGSLTSSNATLTVIDPPVITTQPLGQRVMLGSSVSFTVSVSGTAPFGYLWRFNGSTLLNTTNAAYAIQAVGATNTGNYSVVVTNPAGSMVSSNALLTVIVPPTLALQLWAGYPLLNLYGMLSSNFVVQYNSNLGGTNWINLLSLSNLATSPYPFLDPAGDAEPARFYRAFMQ